MKVINGIRSILFNLAFYVSSLTLIPLMALASLLPGNRMTRPLVKLYCRVNLILARVIMGIKVEYRGVENLPQGALILLSKHQSYMDPMLAFIIRQNVTALAKKELFSIPLLGRVLRKINIIRVDRQSRTAHEAMPAAAEEVIRGNCPLIVYPEATRVGVGERRKLKPGAYYMQRDHDLQVYPVASNAGMFWSRGFWHQPGTVVYEIGDVFPTDLTKDGFIALAEEKVVKRSEQLMIEGGADPSLFE